MNPGNPAVSVSQRRLRDALKVVTALEGGGFAARLAGGCVRDRLLGGDPADYDVATDARPEAVMRHFTAAGIRTVPTGLDHGTVTVIMPSGPVEVTTLRIDLTTDGRRATVAYGTTFEEDAARRDFTINAMFEDARGVIYDYFGGQADLKAGVLRFVGEPVKRIREDYLRILRLFRFWARFGFAPEPMTLAAVAGERDGLARISQERITSELLKIVVGPRADEALRALAATGVWSAVLPDLTDPQAALASLAAFPELQKIESGLRPVACLAALAACRSAASGQAVVGGHALGTRLRLSGLQIQTLTMLLECPDVLAVCGQEVADSLATVDAWEAAAGAGCLESLVSPYVRAIGAAGLAGADQVLGALVRVEAHEIRHGMRRQSRLPLDGGALMALTGIAPGPALGVLLEKAKRAYRNSEFTTAEEMRAWLAAASGGTCGPA